MKEDSTVIQSQLGGTWYEDDPVKLDMELESYLEEVIPHMGNDVIALLAPHAGYRYSGEVAGHAFKQVEGKSYDRVVIIGPSHQIPLDNAASLPNATHIETVFGQIELDRKFIYKLWNVPGFKSVKAAHEGEHSVQIELPFLQHVLGIFKLVPIVAGRMDEESARRIAQALLDNIDSRTLVLVSSDFTHYGKAFGFTPFDEDVPGSIEALDMGAFEFIQRKDRLGFIDYIEKTGATICGSGPINILLAMLPENARVKMLKYDSSGRMSGDWSHSVSYLAAAFAGEWEKKIVVEPTEMDTEPSGVELGDLLTNGVKKILLRLARKTLTNYLRTWERSTPEELKIQVVPSMKEISGVFVTLYKRGELRGCIGEIYPERELYEAVMERAIDAGLRDPRFARVSLDELNDIEFEISVLSPPRPAHSYNEIKIGKHGVVLKKGNRSSVFLPQVAIEQGWDLEQMLSQLSMKAGLCSDDWKNDCSFEVFEAIVFREDIRPASLGATTTPPASHAKGLSQEPLDPPPRPQD